MLPSSTASAAEPFHGVLAVDGYRLMMVQSKSSGATRLDGHLTPDSVAVAICLKGASTITGSELSQALGPEQATVIVKGNSLQWTAIGRQRILVLEVTAAHLMKMGAGHPLRPGVAAAMEGPVKGYAEPVTSALAVLTLAQHLVYPPTHTACLPVWYRAKVLELLAMALFAPAVQVVAEDPAVALNKERVERAALLLERDMENPPTLEMLADEVGCGPFQLSRLFSIHLGKSMPEYLRRRRMERAAVLLATTRQSISDIALTVGYTSFSAFTRGFIRELGVTPSVYRQKENAKRG